MPVIVADVAKVGKKIRNSNIQTVKVLKKAPSNSEF